MSLEPRTPAAANGIVLEEPKRPAFASPSPRLRLNPNNDHNPDNYDDMQLDFSPEIFTSLEQYLPASMLGKPRYDKFKFMREILLKYFPPGERNRVCFIKIFSFFLLNSVWLLGIWWKRKRLEDAWNFQSYIIFYNCDLIVAIWALN